MKIFSSYLRWLLLAALIVAMDPAAGAQPAPATRSDLEIKEAWTRATPPGAVVAAGYLEIRNTGRQPERFLGAATKLAERIELHVVVREGNVVGMREVKSLEVPAGQVLRLAPGGAHLMIVKPRAPFRAGERVPVMLRFERAGEIPAELEVRAPGAHGSHH